MPLGRDGWRLRHGHRSVTHLHKFSNVASAGSVNKITVSLKNGDMVEKRLLAMGKAMEFAVPNALQDAVELSQGMLDTTIATMVGGDMRMHNIKSRRLSARGGVRNQARSAGQAAVGPVGPVALIDQGAPAHVIGVGKQSSATRTFSFPGVTKGYGVRKARDITLGRKVKVLSWIGTDGKRQYRRAPLHHPGFTGKNRWVPTRDGPLRKALPSVMAAPTTRAIAGIFRG